MIYTFAGFELDTRAFELRRANANTVVAMEPQAFDVLRYLVEHNDRVATKEELLDSVWGTRFVTESALTSRIKDVRKAVGDDGRSQQVIRTVHGRGYRFVATVSCSGEDDSRADHRTTSTSFDASELLERGRELESLVAALDIARTRREGSVVLVAGEAGIGKSALVRAFGEIAKAHAVRLLVGGCDDMITARPMGPLRDIAYDLADQLDGVFAPDADIEHVFAALRGVLAEQVTVLVIEDIHWADDATLDVIRYLARRIDGLPAVLVVTYRQGEGGSEHRLRRVLGSLTGTSVRRMVLSPLSADATAQLAVGRSIEADELYRVTQGNPFFVTEVLATGDMSVPPTVRDAVLSRVEALGPEARDVLEHAAVIPSRAERWLVDAVVPAGAIGTAEAEYTSVLSGDDRYIWFRHELARRAVEEHLPPAARMRAHQQVLDALAAHGAVEPARLVHHAEQAGDIGTFVAHAPVAAADALRLGSYSQAIHVLERLLDHADKLPESAVADTASRLSYALYMVNRFADSARYGRRGVAAAELAGDPRVLADALLSLSRTLYWSDGPRAATVAAQRALSMVQALDDERRIAAAHAEMARARSDLASVGSVGEPSPDVIEHAERSLTLAEHLGDSYLRCHALQYRGTGRISVGDERGLEDVALAVELAHLDPRDETPTRACVNAAGGSLRAGRLDDAERYATLGLERGRGGEFTAGAYRLELTLQVVHMNRGVWDRAEEGLRTLVEWPGEPGIMRPLAASVLVRLLARQGRDDEARSILEGAVEGMADSSEIALVGPVTVAALEAAWLGGRATDMPAVAAPALALANDVGHRTTQAELIRLLQLAGHDVAVPVDPINPWAFGFAGRWQDAADAWAAHGCRYEGALELALAPDSRARSRGRADLDALGARATLAALG
jgi:DNA-binding winged helix-turn-helix (wHTH) protein